MKMLSRLLLITILMSTIHAVSAARETARIDFSIQSPIAESIACRIHLANENNQPIKANGQPFWKDHFTCPGRVTVEVPPGVYRWTIEKGPEYEQVTGELQIKANQVSTVNVTLKRIAHLRQGGWYSGDLHIHRAIKDVPALIKAEDLDFAPVITWWNSPASTREFVPRTQSRFDGHRIMEVLAGEDEREGGALLYFGLQRPLDLSVESREFPSPMHFVNQARTETPDVWIDIEKPFWWDVPTWLASEQMNSIGIANNHMCRNQMYESEAWGRPRDSNRLPAPRGNGFWTQEIYYHMLNCGIRLPPSAGSASGVLPNPVGYNRVYVHLDLPFTRDRWFEGLADGRCFVTNGPLLIATVNGQLPGTTFQYTNHRNQSMNLSIDLTSRDPIDQIEIIHNGQLLESISGTTQLTQKHSLTLPLAKPGWILVRAITNRQDTFRFASTAPWYIDAESQQPVINEASAKFFLNWVDERISRIEKNVRNPQQRQSILAPHREARRFWQQRVSQSSPGH